MFRKWSIMLAATLVFLPLANLLAAPKECTSYYCYNPQAAAKAKAKKKARMRRSGYPERLIALVSKLADCVGCVETAPDGFQIKVVYNNGSSKQIGWNRQSEYLARQQLKSGKIKSFHIIYTRTACECCDCRESVQKEPTYKKPKKGISIDFTNPRALGGMPPDLFKPRVGRNPPSARLGDIERPEPPRIAQALCPACRHLADKLNELTEERYQWQKERYRLLRNIRAIQQGIQNDLDKLSELNDLASSGEVVAKRARQQQVYEAHVADLKREKQKLNEVEEKISELDKEIDKIEQELLACEKTCLKKRARRYDDKKPAFQKNQFGLHVSYDSQRLRSEIQFDEDIFSSGPKSYRYSDIGLDLALRVPNYPFYVYIDGSKSFANSRQIFNERTSGDAAENSTVDVKYLGQFFVGIGFIPYETANFMASIGAGKMIFQQKLNAKIVEDRDTRITEDSSFLTNSIFIAAQQKICDSCLLHHSLVINAKLFASKLPAKEVQITTHNLNTYSFNQQGFWQYSARLGIGMLF